MTVDVWMPHMLMLVSILHPYKSRLGMVEHHREPEYCAKSLVRYFQGQGHSEGGFYIKPE